MHTMTREHFIQVNSLSMVIDLGLRCYVLHKAQRLHPCHVKQLKKPLGNSGQQSAADGLP